MSLGELIRAVEAGEWQFVMPEPRRFSQFETSCILGAYHGSLDAALALHNAVLPNTDGWWWSVEHEDPDAPGYRACVWNNKVPRHKLRANALGDTPARSWLLAILRALEAEAGQ